VNFKVADGRRIEGLERAAAELTRKQRGRVFSYVRYAEILNEGMGGAR